ncbi:MAG: hypothetical protein JKY50_03730 [Oleispira sp.]|nr:hypothetical protein [Oleispira sp.]
MLKFKTSLQLIGFLLTVTGGLILILASTSINSELFVNILIATGTGSAAIFTAQAAKATRDSADQWREQKNMI